MQIISIKSPAKINIILRVLNKKRQNLHCIQSVMQTISFFDEVFIKKTKKNIIVKQEGKTFIPVQQNSVYKAAKLFFDETKIDGGVKIILKKNIPIGAGLGGGSSNAASTLVALYRLWNIPIKWEKLNKLALKLGSDVPFFLKGGTSLVEGIGEKITELSPLKSLWFVLVKPNISISTAWAYSALDRYSESLVANYPTDRKLHGLQLTKGRNCIKLFLSYIGADKIENLCSCAYNDFELIITKHYPVIRQIRTKLREAGAGFISMSGSGSTMFAMETSQERGRRIYNKMRKAMPGCIIHLVKARSRVNLH